MNSKIIISNSFAATKKDIELHCYDLMRFFEYETLLLDGVKEIIAEAIISERAPKVIIIFAKFWRVESQNALLKILEEPPKNVSFVLVAPAKNAFLPTIRSRLIIEGFSSSVATMPTGLDLKRLNIATIERFVSQKAELAKGDELDRASQLALIKSIVFEAIHAKIAFSEQDLRYFFKLWRLSDLNAKPVQILTPLLLLIMERAR